MPCLGSSLRSCSSTTTEFASPGLNTMPTRLALGATRLISSICLPSSSASDTPVMFVPEAAIDGTSLAATGSVTAEYTSGMSLVAAATGLGRRGGDGDDHVRLVADELARDLRRGAGIALCALVLPLQVLAILVAGGSQCFLDAVAHGVERRVLARSR